MSILPAAHPSAPPPAGTPGISAPIQSPRLLAPAALSPTLFWSLLLALTALGAFLRFWRLDFQAYWTDEAYTLNRINGTYNYMLNQLSDQTFPPGWYTLLRFWRIFGEVNLHLPAADTFQPGFLRLLPAFFGTLTVPAMYFLARQFTDRRGALLVMLLAAVNPFLIYYSRDIKMYAALYFLATLNMALFFHWQTTRRHIVWFPLFALSALAMTTMHDTAWIIVALQLIFLLTRPKPKAWDAPLWLLAAGTAVIIPYFWHYVVNSPSRMQARMGTDVDKGMLWIQDYTDMSWQTIAGLPTSHLLGYLWPVYPPNERLDHWFLLGGDDFLSHLATRSWAWMAHGQFYAAVGLFSILLLGLIPWRRFRLRSKPHVAPREPLTPPNAVTRGRCWWVFVWIALPSAAFACTWIPNPQDMQNDLTEQQMERSHAVQALQIAQRDLAIANRENNAAHRADAQSEIDQQQDEIKQIDAEMADLRKSIDGSWYDLVWHGARLKRFWEPRYLGIIVPAWLLWLGAALRRMPTWPLRAVLITAVAGVCTFSSLSNHLLYRNTPFQREAAILEKFIDPKDRFAAAVAVPEVKYADPAENTATTLARHVVPNSDQDDYMPWAAYNRAGRDPSFWPPGLSDEEEIVDWLKNGVANKPKPKLLVLTDRYGDLPADEDLLSNEAIAQILSPRWKLVYEERYTWHYEWRFYIFHTWRTRVWKLQTP